MLPQLPQNQGQAKSPYIAVPQVFWIVPVLILLVGAHELPYSYYWFLRVSVTIFAIFFAYKELEATDEFTVFFFALSASAILYNPIIPVSFPKEVWIGLNLATAGLFFLHMGRGAKQNAPEVNFRNETETEDQELL